MHIFGYDHVKKKIKKTCAVVLSEKQYLKIFEGMYLLSAAFFRKNGNSA